MQGSVAQTPRRHGNHGYLGHLLRHSMYQLKQQSSKSYLDFKAAASAYGRRMGLAESSGASAIAESQKFVLPAGSRGCPVVLGKPTATSAGLPHA